MFTGIIHHQGVFKKKSAGRLYIEAAAGLVGELALGESIAVNGVCLTVSGIAPRATFLADVMPETLRRTTLGGLKPGSPVNLELPLKAGGHFGGHIVQGHVDGTAIIKCIRRSGNSRVISFSAPDALRKYMVEKGSVAIDGISLTLIEVNDDGFSVGVIPHTKSCTTLASAAVGDAVNVETDVVAKYVHKFSRPLFAQHHEK
ncbi:MAG: riboflavin synthase [Patescibacteria group bacterium]